MELDNNLEVTSGISNNFVRTTYLLTIHTKFRIARLSLKRGGILLSKSASCTNFTNRSLLPGVRIGPADFKRVPDVLFTLPF